MTDSHFSLVYLNYPSLVSLAAGTAPDFDDLFAPLEKVKCHFEGVWSTVNLLNMVSDVLDRDRAATLHRRAERAFASIHGSRTIFDALVAMRERHDSGQAVLDSDRLRILERYLLEYKHQGYGIGEKKFEELNNNWMKRLAIAKNDYSYKTQWMTELFRSTVSDANVVRDFPLDVLKAMSLDR
jgi:Zn-dependent oligopeptidase